MRRRGVLRVRLAVGPSNEVALNVLGQIIRLVPEERFTSRGLVSDSEGLSVAIYALLFDIYTVYWITSRAVRKQWHAARNRGAYPKA